LFPASLLTLLATTLLMFFFNSYPSNIFDYDVIQKISAGADVFEIEVNNQNAINFFLVTGGAVFEKHSDHIESSHLAPSFKIFLFFLVAFLIVSLLVGVN
jgi:hypothetical protein